MSTRLNKRQQEEINGSWIFFNDCPWEGTIDSLSSLTKDQLEWIRDTAETYEAVHRDNALYYATEDDKKLASLSNALEISMASLRKKCAYLISKKK